jgi:hypothetical protein
MGNRLGSSEERRSALKKSSCEKKRGVEVGSDRRGVESLSTSACSLNINSPSRECTSVHITEIERIGSGWQTIEHWKTRSVVKMDEARTISHRSQMQSTYLGPSNPQSGKGNNECLGREEGDRLHWWESSSNHLGERPDQAGASDERNKSSRRPTERESSSQ